MGGSGEAKFGGRPIHGGAAYRRPPLGAEAEARPRAHRHIDAVGGERLLDARIAREAQDLQVDAFLLIDFGLDADLGSPESEGIGNRLAEPDLSEPATSPALHNTRPR